MADKDYEKYLYLISRLIRLYNIIIKYYADFNPKQLELLNIQASQADVICSHIKDGFMPERYNVNYFETFVAEFEDFVVKSFQWYDLTWKNQKPFV